MTDHNNRLASQQTLYEVVNQPLADTPLCAKALDELMQLRRIVQRLIGEMAYMGELLGDDGNGHVPTLLTRRIKEWNENTSTHQS